MSNKSWVMAGAIATLAVTVTPAYAGRVLRVSAEAALDGSVPLVVHSEGGGIILDFSPTGEVIQKISLDDPSKIVYDHCLLSKSCGTRPSPTVRLFRSKGIAFADLPSVKATLLTVETLDSSNEWHSYIFPVTTSNAPATYNKVLIGDAPSRGYSRYKGGSTLSSQPTLNSPESSYPITALGVRQAEAQNLLVDPQLKGRVRTYLQLTRAGMSDKAASKKAGISLALVQHLQLLGQQRAEAIASQQNASTSNKVADVTAPEQTTEAVPVPKIEGKPKQGNKPRHDKQKPRPEAIVQTVIAKTPKPQPETISTTASTVETANLPEVPNPDTKAQPQAIAPSQSSALSLTPAKSATITSAPSKAKIVARQNRRIKSAVAKAQTSEIDNQAYANALLRGLNKARLDGKIRYFSSKWFAVNNAIRTLRRGGSLERAIAASGMKRDGFMRLLSDGGFQG